jgi:hypothetical protein
LGVLYFIVALIAAMAGAICIAHALRLPKVRRGTESFRRFPRVALGELRVGMSALTCGEIHPGARTLEVPHTFERAVWIRYRMEELGREYRCIAEYVEQEPFLLHGEPMTRSVSVDLALAHVNARPCPAKLTSELFDDEMPVFSLALPQDFQDLAFAKMEEKPGLYRLIVEPLLVGEQLWVSARVMPHAEQLHVQLAHAPEVPMFASSLPESEVLANPHSWLMPLWIALGVALIGLALRVFVFAAQ